MPKIVVLRIFDDFSGDLIQLFQVSAARYIPIFVHLTSLKWYRPRCEWWTLWFCRGTQMEWRKTSLSLDNNLHITEGILYILKKGS